MKHLSIILLCLSLAAPALADGGGSVYWGRRRADAVAAYQYPTNWMKIFYTFEVGPNGERTNAAGEVWNQFDSATNAGIRQAGGNEPQFVEPTNDWTTTMYFGGDDWMDVGTEYLLNGATAVTYSAWFRSDAVLQPDAAPALATRGAAYMSIFSARAVMFRTEHAVPTLDAMDYVFLGAGGWQHLIMSHTSSGVTRTMINGVLLDYATASAQAPYAQDDVLKIPFDDFKATRMQRALFDDIAVWPNWGASSNEMVAIYEGIRNTHTYAFPGGDTVAQFAFATNEPSRITDTWGGVEATNAATIWFAAGVRTNKASGYIRFDAPPNNYNAGWSWSFWLWSRTNQAASTGIAMNRPGAGDLILNSSGMNITLIDPGQTVTVTNALPVGQWTHVGLSSGPSGRQLYINGVLSATAAAVGVPYSAITGPLDIGNDTALASTRWFNGGLGRVDLYKKPLTSNEWSAAYNSMTNVYNSTLVPE